MFPNCTDRFDRQKRETTQKQTKKNQEKNKIISKQKMGIIVPTIDHYLRNELEGDPDFFTR